MSHKAEILIYPSLEFNQSSYIHTGLFELEKIGAIKCRSQFYYKHHRGRISTEKGEISRTNHYQEKTSFYKLIDKNNKRIYIFAVDTYDIPYYFSEYALNNCDYIFKRNYNSKYIDILDDKIKNKIYPLGLTFMVRSLNERYLSLKLISTIFENIRLLYFDSAVFNKTVSTSLKIYDKYLKYISTRSIENFNYYSSKNDKLVIFQTRCFPNIQDPDVFAIHEQRAELIRTLKKRLGGKFIGGFIPDEISTKYYPDCVTSLPSDPHSYLKLVKSAAIGIYTRGLAFSPAWKMAEYLSQGKCIVAEPLYTELPVPLEDNKHLIYFNDAEECADICHRLINDPVQMNELSKNARIYYEQNVEPSKNIQRIINIILNNTPK